MLIFLNGNAPKAAQSVAVRGAVPMASTNDDSTASAKKSAIDHYKWMLDIQIRTLNHIDSKSVSQIAFVGTVLVAAIAGMGLLARIEPQVIGIAQGTPVVALLAFFIAVSSLLLSVGYSIIAITVGWFAYGLHPTIGETIIKGSLEREEYTDLLLRGYSNAITANESVIEITGERFRKANSAMLTGMIALVVALVLYFYGSDQPVEYVLLIAGSILVWSLNEHILSGAILTQSDRGMLDEPP